MTVLPGGGGTRLALFEDRFGNGVGIRGKAIDHHLRQFALDELLDIAQKWPFIDTDEGDRLADITGPTGAANAVDVVFGDIRQLIVDHMGELINIEAACSDIGGDENAYLATLEVSEGARACPLALVAVDRRGANAILLQLFGEAVGAMFGACKYQHLAPVVAANEPGEQLAFAVTIHGVDRLRYTLDRCIAPRHLNADRFVQQGGSQGADLIREGGREEEILPAVIAVGWQLGKDAANIANKSHVEHTIGLVKHEDLDL
jgi:hypothetical protein